MKCLICKTIFPHEKICSKECRQADLDIAKITPENKVTREIIDRMKAGLLKRSKTNGHPDNLSSSSDRRK